MDPLDEMQHDGPWNTMPNLVIISRYFKAKPGQKTTEHIAEINALSEHDAQELTWFINELYGKIASAV